jgi:hypothetical protein
MSWTVISLAWVAGPLRFAKSPVSPPPRIPAEGQLSGVTALLNRAAVEVFAASSKSPYPRFCDSDASPHPQPLSGSTVFDPEAQTRRELAEVREGIGEKQEWSHCRGVDQVPGFPSPPPSTRSIEPLSNVPSAKSI